MLTIDKKPKLFSEGVKAAEGGCTFGKHQAEYKNLKAKPETNRQGVFLKQLNELKISRTNEEGITEALKCVPTIAMKTIIDDTVKLVFPDNTTKVKAI